MRSLCLWLLNGQCELNQIRLVWSHPPPEGHDNTVVNGDRSVKHVTVIIDTS